jgi:hypothetical protein
MIVNDHYEKCFKTQKNFVNFVKINTSDIADYDVEDIERIVQGIASNMYYSTRNIETAKSDYIVLVEMLIRKGFIFKDLQNLKPDIKYPN